MKKIIVKELQIGNGIPKIIVPIVGKTDEVLMDEVAFLKQIDFDIIEWRIDHFKDINDIDRVKCMAKQINTMIGDKPLLVTFRSINEGGSFPASTDFYIKLNTEIILSGLIDLIDIEICIGDESVKNIIELAHQNNIVVIASNHDFDKTPSKDQIVKRLRKMCDLGADIAKIAVMPHCVDDVLTLLSATNEMRQKHPDMPLITMSMGRLGVISRVAGETFGSDLTFGAAKNASAPGQLDAKSLRSALHILHQG